MRRFVPYLRTGHKYGVKNYWNFVTERKLLVPNRHKILWSVLCCDSLQSCPSFLIEESSARPTLLRVETVSDRPTGLCSVGGRGAEGIDILKPIIPIYSYLVCYIYFKNRFMYYIPLMNHTRWILKLIIMITIKI